MDFSAQEKELRGLLGRNIKNYRFREGVSQLELALNLNISPAFLSDIENGKKWPSPLTLVRIADALHASACGFFTPEAVASASDATAKVFESYLADIRSTVKQSVEKSIEESGYFKKS